MTLTVKEVEEMRNALSATFGANVAADLGEKFLNHLAGQSSPYMRATASEYGEFFTSRRVRAGDYWVHQEHPWVYTTTICVVQ